MEGLAIGNTVFTMGGAAASLVQVLMGVRRYGVKVRDWFVVTLVNHSSVKKHYKFPGPLGSELDSGQRSRQEAWPKGNICWLA